MSQTPHLFLDDHMPEVMEGHWLWSLGSQKGLLTVGEGDLAGVHVGHLRGEMRTEKRGELPPLSLGMLSYRQRGICRFGKNPVFSLLGRAPYLFWALEHLILETDVIVIKRS